jgi:hypothetical protein
MADNLDITPGSGAAKTRSHATGTIHTQIIKLALGATNAVETIIAAGRAVMAASIPVVLPSDMHDAVVPQTIAELASASILGTFVSVGTFAAGTRIGTLVNTTSVILVFSLNGGTNAHRRVFPFSKENIDLGPSFAKTAAAVYVKYDTVSPGSGNGVAAIEGLSV